jgi:Spy/CpxP family protein refolding chaperone
MNRIRVLVAILAIALCSLAVLAQDKPLPPRASLPAGWKALGLTDQQKSQIYKILADARAKIADLETQIKAVRTQERQDLLKILTPAQQARLKEIREEKTVTPVKPEPKKEEKKPDDKK